LGDDRYRHQSLLSFATVYHGHQDRKIGAAQVVEARPVSFYREYEPNKYVKVLREVYVDKIVQRRIEVLKEVPTIRYVDRIVTREVPHFYFPLLC
jgi:hypothetical protein